MTNNQFPKQKKEGFTLIELIVVITIIAIVSVVAIVSFGGTNKKARDGRRVADLEKYRVALEMARQIGATYPANLSSLVTMSLMGGTATDPMYKSGYNYYYAVGSPAYSYELYGQMEDLGSTNGSYGGNCGGTCNYKITNP